MTTISAKIIADSISQEGKRLPTMQLRYPLVIHAESKTHRLLSESGETVEEYISPGIMNDPNLSRNARSSRAVPVEKMIQEAIDDPFIPLHWGAAQKGMQAYEECNAPVTLERIVIEDGSGESVWGIAAFTREEAWLEARDNAVNSAWAFHKAGYAKQLVNRLLAPFLHIDTLCTATEWDNFFELRDHPAAEPHMQMLARAMKKALDESAPKKLAPGEWHLPYITKEEKKDAYNGPSQSYSWETLKQVSAARCARISYEPFDGNGSIEAELKRYESLVGSKPIHASPVEHIATPDEQWCDGSGEWLNPHLHGNLTGWVQYRKVIEEELK